MKKFLSLLILCWMTFSCYAQEGAANNATTTLYGLLRYSDAEMQEYGLMQVEASTDAVPTMVWKDTDMVLMGNGGAVYIDGKYYVLTYMDFFGMLMATYVVADPREHTYQPVGEEVVNITFAYISADQTYDATTGKVYAVSLNSKGDGSFVLSTMDMRTAEKKPIAPVRQLCALAADKDGQLYGIDMNGVLCKVNKETAAINPIGSTGVKPAADCSAEFDPVSGTLYWSAYTENGGALYTVDITTGEATLVNTYPNGQQITGIFFEAPEKPQGAPAPVEYSALEFDNASLKGKVYFELPTKDIADNALNAPLTWTLDINSEQVATGTGLPGEEVEVSVEVPVDDMYLFVIGVANEVGEADVHSIERYIGYDTPKQPEAIKLSADNGVMNLTWTTSATGINGGYLDLETLQHRIVRLPDGVVVADDLVGNKFTETLPVDGIHAYYYQITPRMEDYVGAFDYSNVDTVGCHLTVPFREDFEDVMRYILYTSVDANEDECYWTWTTLPEEAEHAPCATYMWGLADKNNDWLISPPVYLEKNKQYTATYRVRGEDDKYAGTLQPAIGTTDAPDSFTYLTSEPMTIDFATDSTLVASGFTVPTTGDYRLGLQVGGKRSHYYIYLTALEVVEGATGVDNQLCQPNELRLRLEGDRLHVENPAEEVVSVYTADGKLFCSDSSRHVSLTLPAGVYVVKQGVVSQKVVIR